MKSCAHLLSRAVALPKECIPSTFHLLWHVMVLAPHHGAHQNHYHLLFDCLKVGDCLHNLVITQNSISGIRRINL